jgi:hypothetical protein
LHLYHQAKLHLFKTITTMTLLDGHGRTPHDTWERTQSAAVMLCCLPCLGVIVCIKTLGKIIHNMLEPKEKAEEEIMERTAKGGLGIAVPTGKGAETESH